MLCQHGQGRDRDTDVAFTKSGYMLLSVCLLGMHGVLSGNAQASTELLDVLPKVWCVL